VEHLLSDIDERNNNLFTRQSMLKTDFLSQGAILLSSLLEFAKEDLGIADVQYVDDECPASVGGHKLGGGVGRGGFSCIGNGRVEGFNKEVDRSGKGTVEDYVRIPVVVGEETVGAVVFLGLQQRVSDGKEEFESLVEKCKLLARHIEIALGLYEKGIKAINELQGLRRSRGRLLAKQDEVMRETAELLHGHVQAQLLYSCQKLRETIAMLGGNSGKAGQQLQDVLDGLERLREADLRKVAKELYPNITIFGLLPSLRSLVNKTLVCFREEVNVSIDADPALEELDYPGRSLMNQVVRVAGYKLVEEAISNAIIHGEASEIRVGLYLDRHRSLVVEVMDNGRGFVVDMQEFGFGLSSIDARVTELAGYWSLKSEEGKGTTIRATFPGEVVFGRGEGRVEMKRE